MAPKAEKQPAKKSVAKVGGAKPGKKKGGSKKSIESYKIYIYKVYLSVSSCQCVFCCAQYLQIARLDVRPRHNVRETA